MADNNDRELPPIGFLFRYPEPTHPTEKFHLDIFISSEPTETHFDVLKVYFPALTSNGPVSDLKVSHPWTFEKQLRACVGLVIMEDRKGEKVEGFTFGGTVDIKTEKLQTVCTLVSRAPILHFSEAPQVVKLFIEEVEILLAQEQAKYQDSLEFQTRICKADPLQLYLACLIEVKRKMEKLRNREDEYNALLDYTHIQQHRLTKAGLYKGSITTLQDLIN